jgi:hypothetical protein
MSLPPSSGTQTEVLPSRPGEGASEEDGIPAPGALHIKGRRSWSTWQLLVVALVAVVVGFWLNGTTQSSSKASSAAPAYKVPASTGSTTTTAAGGATTTTAAGEATTPSATAGPAGVLLPSTQKQGNWTSPPFTTTVAGWNIGWAFSCTPAPPSGASFQVFVTPSGGTPSGTPAVSGTGASGQAVTAQSSLGAQTLVVQAPASCEWVVKVTGS